MQTWRSWDDRSDSAWAFDDNRGDGYKLTDSFLFSDFNLLHFHLSHSLLSVLFYEGTIVQVAPTGLTAVVMLCTVVRNPILTMDLFWVTLFSSEFLTVQHSYASSSQNMLFCYVCVCVCVYSKLLICFITLCWQSCCLVEWGTFQGEEKDTSSEGFTWTGYISDHPHIHRNPLPVHCFGSSRTWFTDKLLCFLYFNILFFSQNLFLPKTTHLRALLVQCLFITD